MRVELDVDLRPERPEPAPKPVADLGAVAEKRRRLQEERFLRRVALARVIEVRIAAGEFADLADIARRCGVSRTRVSAIASMVAVSHIA